jgi:proteasome lid subunit RPN8/RPN11
VNVEVGIRTARIARGALDAVVTHAREAAPAECCGLLIGSPESIVDALRTRNIADDPASRFLIDPKDHFDGRREARRRSLDVVGFYHSHPRSPAEPSARDRAEAGYPGDLYLIVSLFVEPPEIRVFRNFVPVPFAIVR